MLSLGGSGVLGRVGLRRRLRRFTLHRPAASEHEFADFSCGTVRLRDARGRAHETVGPRPLHFLTKSPTPTVGILYTLPADALSKMHPLCPETLSNKDIPANTSKLARYMRDKVRI